MAIIPRLFKNSAWNSAILVDNSVDSFKGDPQKRKTTASSSLADDNRGDPS